MNFELFRLGQQIRLWIYIALFILGVVSIWRDRHDGIGAVLALSGLLLMFLETCPRCGRQVLKEGQRSGGWWLIVPVRVWWIGTHCREEKRAENPE